MPELTQLVYVSRRPADLSTSQIIDGIALPAMHRNLAAGITGCLWFGGQHFLQVIEGEPDAIETLFARIRRDARHADVRVVSERSLDDRAFVRYSLRHIESDEIDEVQRLIDHYVPPEPPAEERPAEAQDLIAAAVSRLRSFLLL